MDPVILKQIPFDLDPEIIKERLRLDEDEDYAKAMDIAARAGDIARPKAVFKAAYIDERDSDSVVIDGIRFNSRLIRANLSEVHRVFPYVVTSGIEVEEWSREISDILERYWADTIKEIILGAATEFVNSKIKSLFGLNKISSMNPGSLEDWPLNQQSPLFALIGKAHTDAIGVELTDSMLMIPPKTISGIFFPTEIDYENCKLCSRKNCQGRRAPFDEHLYKEMLG